MKYLLKFNNNSDYQSFKKSDEFVLPNVSTVKDENKVCYHPYVKNVPKNVLTYTASEKIRINESAFNCSVASHEFINGVGTITFEEDLTKIGQYAFESC